MRLERLRDMSVVITAVSLITAVFFAWLWLTALSERVDILSNRITILVSRVDELNRSEPEERKMSAEKQAKLDQRWWKVLEKPLSWRLIGWSDQATGTFLTNDRQTLQLTGEQRSQIVKAIRKSEAR